MCIGAAQSLPGAGSVKEGKGLSMDTGCIFNLRRDCSKISGENYNPVEATKLHLAARFKGEKFWYMNSTSKKLLFKKLSYEKLCFGE